MNEPQNLRINAATATALTTRGIPPIRLTQAWQPCPIQLALPTVPRGRLGRSSPSLRAAVHVAEFAEWQASGGDFLHRSHAKRFIRADRATRVH